MAHSIVDKILKERELKNEKRVAITRLIIFASAFVLDCLSFFTVISYTQISATLITLALDLCLFLVSFIILLIIQRNIYSKFTKFLSISLDYTLISLILLLDPTIPRGEQTILWPIMIAFLFLFLLNLLRHSKSGTLYAGILSISLFVGMGLGLRQGSANDMVAMVFGLASMVFIGYSLTDSSKKMMEEANTKKMMERYLPPQLIGELYKKDVSLEPGGAIQRVTILFSDIRSFTTLSEAMSANEVVYLLNDYLSTMTDIIFRNNGTLDKFIGDAIMTTFGAPVKSDDDALRSVKTAISMIQSLRDINERHSYLSHPLEIGIGIHTGEVIVGNIGSERRLDYTVIGDNVNLSSRIENLTQYYRCPILISETTYTELCGKERENSFVVREVDHVIVKGKTTRIRLYEVLCFKNPEEEKEIKLLKEVFEKGLDLYRKRQFPEALIHFNRLQEDRLSQLYVQRCMKYLDIPPDESWEGVFRSEQKS